VRSSLSYIRILRDRCQEACKALSLGAIELCGVLETEMGRSHSSAARSDATWWGVNGTATLDALLDDMGGWEQGLEKRHKW
jgi:hypothetical protein